ncbi:MAG: glyceraldehyde-3-phosphate dehydrogenase [Halocynthiibacter sp.]
MTDRIALWVGLSLLVFFILIFVFYGSDGLYFLLKKIDQLIEWIAFWR